MKPEDWERKNEREHLNLLHFESLTWKYLLGHLLRGYLKKWGPFGPFEWVAISVTTVVSKQPLISLLDTMQRCYQARLLPWHRVWRCCTHTKSFYCLFLGCSGRLCFVERLCSMDEWTRDAWENRVSNTAVLFCFQVCTRELQWGKKCLGY